MAGILSRKQMVKSFVGLGFLALLSGFGNAAIIGLINTAVYVTDAEYKKTLALCFLGGIFLYLISQKLLRTKFIQITNEMIYAKRVEITNNILKTSFEKFEKIDTGRIYAGLNNDTEIISESANLIILGVTSSTTIICCLIYLSTVYVKGLLIALVVIAIAMFLYFIVGQKARRLWNQSRDIQNKFFQFINDLLYGFKELAIHQDKREEFKKDMFYQSNLYKEKRIEASVKFANVFILGEFLFTSVIGTVVFLFPLMFSGIDNQVLISFVIIFLYMSSPVYTLLNTVPNLIQVKISFERINQLIDELRLVKEQTDISETVKAPLTLTVKDLCYEYQTGDDTKFKVGPINYQFQSGQIIFITGGNGSGKSTIAKLLTGLYKAKSGTIMINGKEVHPKELGQYYSAVFSDSFLFDKLYGIDWSNKKQTIEQLMKLLRIEQKVSIRDGAFSQTKLSTGQRKRLALLISYLEDRKIYLFDEWAADQDPEFRKFFYEELIFQLKNMGKCVIAITHDDRYFNLADKVIKLDMGRIVNEEERKE